MAKKKGLPALLLLLLLVFIWVFPDLATGDPEETAGGQPSTVNDLVYGTDGEESDAPAPPAGLQVMSVASEVYSGPDQIILTWTGDPRTTQTVAWRVYGTGGGTVQYMLQDDFEGDFSSALEEDAPDSGLYDGFRHCEAELDGLQPGATYVYRVGGDDGWSEPAAFATAADTDDFSFMYMGDIQRGYGAWGQLLQQAYAGYPEAMFTIQSGDLIDSAESDVQWLEWQELFTAADGVFDRKPFMPALGNHEYANPALYFKTFALPQNGPDGLKESFYSFDYGNAHFVVLDSNRMGSDGADYEAGISWLASDLQSSNKKWKFVVLHHPPYIVNAGGSNDATIAGVLRQYWVPVMEQNGVDMVLMGHEQMYMRTYPLYEEQIREKPTEGITYLMGNAGEKYYTNPEQHDYVAKVIPGVPSCFNYTIFHLDGDVLTMTTRNAGGAVLDEYKINKNKVMDSRVTVGGVKLLNGAYREIDSVTSRGSFRLQAGLNNNTSSRQQVTTVLQVRGGAGAGAASGGQSLGIVSLQAEAPPGGADVYADFTLPDLPAGKAYVDVYVLDENNMPVDVPYQKFSFNVDSL